MIKFRLVCHPIGQHWKTAVIHGHARIYESTQDREAKAEIRVLAEPHRPEVPLDGPIGIDVIAIFQRTTHLARRSKRTGALLEPACRIWMPQKPDCDNLQKGLFDALKTFWVDDSRICDERVRKCYAADGEAPGYEIRIWQLDGVGP